MTTRRRSTVGITPEELAQRVPVDLRELPEADLRPGCQTNAYRAYMEELEGFLTEETRRDSRSEAVAVAEVLGTDPASWFRAMLNRPHPLARRL